MTDEEIASRLEGMALEYSGMTVRVKIAQVQINGLKGHIEWDGDRFLITIKPEVEDKTRVLAHELSHIFLNHVVREKLPEAERFAANLGYQLLREGRADPEEWLAWRKREIAADTFADNLIRDWANRMGRRCNLHLGLELPGTGVKKQGVVEDILGEREEAHG